MGIFDNYLEVVKTFKLLEENNLLGETVYFNNVYFLDEKGEKVEILSLSSHETTWNQVYTNLQVNVDDKEMKLVDAPMMVATMVYLRLQKMIREFNG